MAKEPQATDIFDKEIALIKKVAEDDLMTKESARPQIDEIAVQTNGVKPAALTDGSRWSKGARRLST